MLKGDLIDSEFGETLSVTTAVKTEFIHHLDAFNHKNWGDRNDRDDHVKTMDRQDCRNRATKFLDDGDDHMETRLK